MAISTLEARQTLVYVRNMQEACFVFSVEQLCVTSVTSSVECQMLLEVDKYGGVSIENVFRYYVSLHLLASPGPSEFAQRADTLLIL